MAVYIENTYNKVLVEYPYSMLALKTDVELGSHDTTIPPNNEIWYTTKSGELLDKDFSDTQFFGENLELVSHTYEDGIGKAVFSGGNVVMCLIQGEDLENVYLPESCDQVLMVSGTENLEGIYIYSRVAYLAQDEGGYPIIPIFGDGEHKGFRIHVPSDCVNLYKAAWTDFADQIC